MIALLSLVLIATALTFAFGCLYATWGVLADLFSGWSHVSLHSIVPRRFGLGALFTLTAIVAVACLLLDGVRVHGAAQWIGVFAICLVWAAAIVYGFQCMLRECFQRDSASRSTIGGGEAKNVIQTEWNEVGFDRPSINDDRSAELDRWLGERAGEDSPQEGDGCSTKEIRSHFRVKLTDGPKGLRWPGFGRP